MARSLVAFSLVLVFAAQTSAQELQGAEAALRAVRARKAAPEKGPGLAKDVEAFGSGKGLVPAEAARRWLAFFDRYPETSPRGMPTPFATLVAALPAPEAWDAIAAGLRAREAGKKGLLPDSVRFFAAQLKGDPAEEWRALDALAPYGKNPKTAEYVSSTLLEASQLLAAQTGDPTRIVAAFVAFLSQGSQQGGVTIPDLVTLVGSQKAEALLVRAMTTAKGPLNFSEGRATRALSQKVALAHVKELKTPPWDLVDISTLRLYEALDARFRVNIPKAPKTGTADAAAAAVEAAREASQRAAEGGSDAKGRARVLYGFGLLRVGRKAEAAKALATVANFNAYEVMNRLGSELATLVGTHEFTVFLGGLVAGRPASPFWDIYTLAAARSHESGIVVTSLQRTLAAPKLTSKDRAELLGRLSSAQFAADRVDEGLATLRKAIAAPGTSKDEAKNLAVRLATVGRLLNRPATVEEGIALARAAEARPASNPNEGYMVGSDGGLVDLLLDLGRGAEAEREAIRAYVASVSPNGTSSYYGNANPALVTLARVYYRLDRPADVRILLDGAAEWGARDVADLARDDFGYSGGDELPTGFIAAWALAKTGERAAAEGILNRVIAAHGGFDPAYALLRELKGPDALVRLDAIYAADQFEERPLIWKAVVLNDAGRLDEAEAAVRRAIIVDPSDGETHGGRRMFAYTVLADILEAKGDAEGAKGDRDAVAAIRLAEKADELANVGLLARAIAGYEESTRRFSDAYCIQSRLAVDLMEQGREKEAEEHYRRAYELMPGSFGRVETHCMGCEHVFEGEVAQNIAERVFASLVKKTPEKPQVHYLLGYLRFEQGRYAEAMALYRRAVALDPDYLNAWKKMAELETYHPVPAAEARTISNAIMRLDPLGKHGYGEAPTGDLRETWRRVDAALARLGTETPATAYPLVASAAALAKRDMGDDFPDVISNRFGMRGVQKPGDAVVANPLVGLTAGLIDNAQAARGVVSDR